MNAFRAELLKLRRPAVLFGAGLVLPLISAVATLAVVLGAGDAPAEGGGSVTHAALSAAGGLTAGFAATAVFLGILLFVLFATSFGGEHSGGTLRALLTREPCRLRLLAGKWAALAAFLAVTLLLALVASSAVAVVLAPSQGLSTRQWFGSAGLGAALGDYRDVLLSGVLYGTAGAVVATLVRSGPIAVGIGIVWLGPAEHLIADGWSAGARWFPGLLFESIAQGGADGSPYGRALVLGTVLAAAGAALAAAVFARRDVST